MFSVRYTVERWWPIAREKRSLRAIYVVIDADVWILLGAEAPVQLFA